MPPTGASPDGTARSTRGSPSRSARSWARTAIGPGSAPAAGPRDAMPASSLPTRHRRSTYRSAASAHRVPLPATHTSRASSKAPTRRCRRRDPEAWDNRPCSRIGRAHGRRTSARSAIPRGCGRATRHDAPQERRYCPTLSSFDRSSFLQLDPLAYCSKTLVLGQRRAGATRPHSAEDEVQTLFFSFPQMDFDGRT